MRVALPRILDQHGVIRYKDARGAAMDKAVTELLAEMGHEVTLQHDDAEAEH